MKSRYTAIEARFASTAAAKAPCEMSRNAVVIPQVGQAPPAAATGQTGTIGRMTPAGRNDAATASVAPAEQTNQA
jgi:hypothetical protein